MAQGGLLRDVRERLADARIAHRVGRWRRAAVLGCSLGAIAASGLAIHNELAYDVGPHAVYRFWGRSHYDGSLEDLLRNLTKEQVESVQFGAPQGVVHVKDGVPSFYPVPIRTPHEYAEALRIYAELQRATSGDDWERLSTLVGLPAVQARLAKEDVALAAEDFLSPGRAMARNTLRKHADLFFPDQPESMSFEQLLKFYDANAPAGEYVGKYVFLTLHESPRYTAEESKIPVFVVERGPRSIAVRAFHEGKEVRRAYQIF